jgi:chorismate mutase
MTAVGDPVVAALRAEITALDEQLLETINQRLETVEKLRLYKKEHDLPFVDPDREAALIQELRSANRGPLSQEGLNELITFVLDLVKRELASRD